MNDSIQTARQSAKKEVPTALTSIPLSQAVIVKALSDNEGEVRIGQKAEVEAGEGYPLEKGEKISLDLKGTGQVYFECDKDDDGIAILAVAP